MPTISVDKAALFAALGREYTTEEFDELCFEFGLELDEDTTDSDRPIVDGVQEPPELKIEIPANRYDLLCFEGIATMLNVFNKKIEVPKWKLTAPSGGELQSITIKPETEKVRPYVTGAILRNVKLDKARYDSFIALQDKLHQNLARERTLCSIGTHDLDTVKGPFTYEALRPEDISFIPLNQTKEMNGRQLMDFYKQDPHLGRYLHIIKESPVYPVIYDANRVVCSLPPIINGDHSKITLNTKNIFIEVTATDKTKVEIVVNMMVTMFSGYCSEPFTVEPINIISKHNNESRQAPDLTPRETVAEIAYLNSCCGLNLSGSEIGKLLKRMALTAGPSKSSKDHIDVSIPPTRADILHQCDIMEDVAIAYGYNQLPRKTPLNSYTVGEPLKINKLSDILRETAASSGWVEVMPLILCSHEVCFEWLGRKDDGKSAVRLANPKSAEYQIIRTTLIPGLLMSLRENRGHSLPIQIFESSEVAFKDPTKERQSRNERRFAAAFCGTKSGFEVVHGLLGRIMTMLRCDFKGDVKDASDDKDVYWIEEADDPAFFPGRGASIHVRLRGKESKIGLLGTIHPKTLEHFDLKVHLGIVHLGATKWVQRRPPGNIDPRLERQSLCIDVTSWLADLVVALPVTRDAKSMVNTHDVNFKYLCHLLMDALVALT